MEPRIEILAGKKIVGKRIRTTLSANKTYELWHSFMPKRNGIKNRVTTDLLSVQVYNEILDFKNFSPDAEFEEWAATEVLEYDTVPDEFETYTLTGGLYAVFVYKGAADNFSAMFRYIFGTWLPASGYSPDNRAYFEIMKENYKPDDPNSEEEVWIPIKLQE
jgi:AraC family transcriptional regulator